MLTTWSADTHRRNDKTLCECVLHVHMVHTCCGLQAGAFSFGLSKPVSIGVRFIIKLCMNTALCPFSQVPSPRSSNKKRSVPCNFFHDRPAVDRRNFWRSTSIRLTVKWFRELIQLFTFPDGHGRGQANRIA